MISPRLIFPAQLPVLFASFSGTEVEWAALITVFWSVGSYWRSTYSKYFPMIKLSRPGSGYGYRDMHIWRRGNWVGVVSWKKLFRTALEGVSLRLVYIKDENLKWVYEVVLVCGRPLDPECCYHSCIWTIQNGNYKILSSPNLPYHLWKAIGDFVELSCCDILQTMIPSMSSFGLEAPPDHDPIHVLFWTRGTAHAHDTQYHPLGTRLARDQIIKMAEYTSNSR